VLPHQRPPLGAQSSPSRCSQPCSVQNNYPKHPEYKTHTTQRRSTPGAIASGGPGVDHNSWEAALLPITRPAKYGQPGAELLTQQRFPVLYSTEPLPRQQTVQYRTHLRPPLPQTAPPDCLASATQAPGNQYYGCGTHSHAYMCDMCAMSHQQSVGTGAVYTHTLWQTNICLGAPMQHQGTQRQRAHPKPCYQMVWEPQGFAHCCRQCCRCRCSVSLLPLLVSLLLPLLMSLLLLLWCAAPGALAPVCHTRQSPSASRCLPSLHCRTCRHSKEGQQHKGHRNERKDVSATGASHI
jgi:hypothetical protein